MTQPLDDAFLSVADFIEETATLDGDIRDRQAGVAMTVEAVEMSMPIELDLQVDDHGKVLIGAIPPLYYVETTVLPVFHQITVTLELTPSEADGE